MASQEIKILESSFGAELLAEGGVRFRLWAPAAKRVDVKIGVDFYAMENPGDGWFEQTVEHARAGTRYQYRIDGNQLVPDPASRFQPQDVDAASEVIDPRAFRFKPWQTPPWNEAVICELHVGTFTPEGNYRGVISKLDHLKAVGITAIELMPLADFAGRRNWGYDGVLPYAPDSAYGRPEDLKALVQAAHDRGLMVLLDVVYNHFGPKGNYLGHYAPQFFTDRHRTPWGAAIDFSQPAVRRFFVQNALYWLNEYNLDGLRFDAVHAIVDESPTHILAEIRNAAPAGKHLVLENDANQARYIGPGMYTAQWNDDAHHGFHVLATGEDDGYYIAYADAPAKHLARALAEGFAYQGERSPFSNEPRGEPSSHLPPTCFVDFMQNHDQIGNRALGERLLSISSEQKIKALSAIQLLAPAIPLLFMGEEWGCRQPFLFFCDFDGELGEAVRNGRRAEFARFASFGSEVPDPLAEETFQRSVLDWDAADSGWIEHYRQLLDLRRKHIVPRSFGRGRYRMLGKRAFEVTWDGLRLIVNCGDSRVSVERIDQAPLWSNGKPGEPWTVCWWIRE